MTICICGGGSLGHTIAGYIGAKNEYKVNILTQKPQLWSRNINILDCHGHSFKSNLAIISEFPEKVIPDSDIILLCLPGFAIESELIKIKPYLKEKQVVGSVISSTGFFFMAEEILPPTIGRFGFQRVPFISRIDTYGQSATLLGYKKELKLATAFIPQPEHLINTLSGMLDTPIHHASHYLEVSLSNSNPLLHTTRLYSLFKDYQEGIYYDKPCLFYEDWDDACSGLLIACDREFFQILKKLPIHTEEIPTVLNYYESTDAASLTRKIKSIEAFKHLKAPMLKIGRRHYIPDFKNRYFCEDFPFGISFIKYMGEITNTKTPHIDKIIEWGRTFIPMPGFNFKINL